MLKRLSLKDADIIYEIINAAAAAYKNAIPVDCYHEPYMSKEELLREMEVMTFFGWTDNGKITGVMALQRVKDITLIRHAYVLPAFQNQGIGTKLLNHLKSMTKTKDLLVGTWADATWAVDFYQKQGFKLMPDKDRLLETYWHISQRQIDTSVVLCTKI